MRILNILSLCFVLLFTGFDCTQQESTTVTPITPSAATLSDSSHANCLAAETNLKIHSCKEGLPNKNGTTFTQLCDNSAQLNIDFHANCLVKITDCSQVNSCTGSK